MKKYLLEVVVFISGASVMILEIVASRILAPYIGTSIFVWTALIGVILASLSLGYYWGGKIADRASKYFLLRNLVFLASLYIFLVGLSGVDVLKVASRISDIRVSSVVSSFLLFSLPTVLLGMVTPFSVVLKLRNLKDSGKVSGSLYAVSTVGSILGTFWCGFYLLAQIGSRNILFLVSLLLVLCCLFLNLLSEKGRKLWYFLLLAFALVILLFPKRVKLDSLTLADFDTPYSRVIVELTKDRETGREAVGLRKGKFLESLSFREGEGVPVYYNYYDLAFHFNPGINKVLMIGGGGYSYPAYFLERYPGKYIDVVEIDPAMEKVAKEYFRLKESPNLVSYFEDARNYIEKTPEKYGVVMIDAFGTDSVIPFQLVSLEAIERYFAITDEKGMVIINIASAVEGDTGKLLSSAYATFKSVFPYIRLFPKRPDEPGRIQNVILVASKEKLPDMTSKEERITEMLSHEWKREIQKEDYLFTDDFAPVEQLLVKRNNWKYY